MIVHYFYRSLVSGELPGFGKVLITAAPWYGNPGESQRGRVYILSGSKTSIRGNFTDIDDLADQMLEGTSENSRFGYSLAILDFNADGLNDLAVSAPSQGGFFTLAHLHSSSTHRDNLREGGRRGGESLVTLVVG